MITRFLRRLVRHLRGGIIASIAVAIGSFGAAILGLSIAAHLGSRDSAIRVRAEPIALSQLTSVAAKQGWGSGAIALLHADLFAGSTIRPANACGLGATSCFKCHNGTQAKAPDNKPWHVQHIPVNYSCNGCHQGNPRLMVKSIAHTGLLADPLTNPQKACSTCHTNSEKLAKYVAMYRQVAKKEGITP